MSILAAMDLLVRRCERAGWVLLGVVALAMPWFGVEPPLAGNVGEGRIALDIAVTALLCSAALAQLVRMVQAPPHEHITVRAASWLLLLALCLMSGRMAWLLVSYGDIRMTATMAASLLCLSASVLLHAVGRVVYGGTQ